MVVPDNLLQAGPLVLFDGVCNLCSASVRFLARRENGTLWYAAMQSVTGQRLLEQRNLPLDDYDSFLFLENGRLYVKSEAALRLCGYMKQPWPILRALRFVPRPIRDWVYDRIARNRYSLFGKRESCMLPDADLSSRFLS